ncbi:hypothetical protein M0R45_035212 [Rubus argutus]|uniref:Uncharacterized protein n=1 Tax=Rubus argutus TaxID=59490 RepID=A0AAW1VSD7_RUBAR
MDEDVKVASVVSNPVINADVLGTAAMLDRRLQLGGSCGEIKLEEVRTLSAVLKTAFESSNQVVQSAALLDYGGQGGSGGVKEVSPSLSVAFNMGSHQVKPDGDKKGGNRKFVKVKARRKLVLNQEGSAKCEGVEMGKRKKVEEVFCSDGKATKKVMLSSSIPEVVGAAELPHHEQ